MKNKIELLAPAGDLERLKWGIRFGADAVYIGGALFGLRANAINFSLEDMKEALEFAHKHNAKVYVVVNAVLHNKEAKMLLEYLKDLENIKVDAIIASDPAIIDLALSNTNLEVHMSTQESTLNVEAVKYWQKEGVSRIVLGREATKNDIETIIKETGIEIETFVQGAMCTAYSGRCVLSNFFTGRDANRGGCAQICRWDFKLLSEKKKIIQGDKDFTLSTKDLQMLPNLNEMIDAGISSLKVEGRMRSIYYIATVIGTYRKAIDEYYAHGKILNINKYAETLSKVANRESTVQFWNGNYDHTTQYYNGRIEFSNQDFLGVVLDYNKETGYATVEQRNYFKKGDKAEIFGVDINDTEIIFDEIIDEEGNQIEIVRHPRQVVKVKLDKLVNKYNLIRVKK